MNAVRRKGGRKRSSSAVPAKVRRELLDIGKSLAAIADSASFILIALGSPRLKVNTAKALKTFDTFVVQRFGKHLARVKQLRKQVWPNGEPVVKSSKKKRRGASHP
jgi:hypothetical protein